jgi:LacI family transcriptional regulator
MELNGNGLMRSNHRAATIIDVAKAAGVSVSTVSRVVNDYQHVRPAVRLRVQEAMNRLGYAPNRQARRLVGGKSGVIGLMIHALGTEYIAEVIRGIDDALGQVDCDMMLYTTHRHREKEDFYARTIAGGLADGLILVVPSIGESYLDALRESHFPHVMVDVDRSDGKSWSVGITNWQGAYDATRYLLKLNHRRIAIITDQLQLSNSRPRLAGYQAALAECGVPTDPDLVKEDNYMFPFTHTLVESLLNLPDRPSAIFTTGDQAAFRVIETLHRYGLRVPEDMSVVGFDDVPQANTIYPRLTTVHHPLYEMGQMAVQIVMKQIETPSPPVEHIELPTRLEMRESCREWMSMPR